MNIMNLREGIMVIGPQKNGFQACLLDQSLPLVQVISGHSPRNLLDGHHRSLQRRTDGEIPISQFEYSSILERHFRSNATFQETGAKSHPVHIVKLIRVNHMDEENLQCFRHSLLHS